MSPSKTDKIDKTDEAEVEAQSGEEATQYVEPRDVVVSIDVTCRTDDPDVTDAEILAAAEQQVTLPNTIWVSKVGGGQIAVTVVTVTEEPPEIPVE